MNREPARDDEPTPIIQRTDPGEDGAEADTPAATTVRETLTGAFDASSVIRVIDEGPGDLVIMPASTFDEDELPDVDLGTFLVEDDGEARVPVPLHLPRAFRGGFHILSPYHVAMMWFDLRADVLREEVQLREEHDCPVPPVARQRLDREVYR